MPIHIGHSVVDCNIVPGRDAASAMRTACYLWRALSVENGHSAPPQGAKKGQAHESGLKQTDQHARVEHQ
jgi:hypothetical protein